jgi:hypothetical protein
MRRLVDRGHLDFNFSALLSFKVAPCSAAARVLETVIVERESGPLLDGCRNAIEMGLVF